MDCNKPILRMVVPCYNEESILPITAPLFRAELKRNIDDQRISPKSTICFVDDGSSDGTWKIIQELAASDASYEGMALSRNQGHQNALMAGLMEAKDRCDICISLDCDGQDDISAVSRMIDEYLNGADVVYGVRSRRESDTLFKRLSAEGFYAFLDKMGVEVVFNHSDYRLMSARALQGLSQFGEANLYLRGLVPLVGYPSATVEYERSARVAGSSHYSLGKMLSLALDGVTSLSVKPIRIVSGVGLLFCLIGFVGILWAVITALTGNSVSGWASTICLVCMFGGLQLLALGVIGEYVGKIYLEVKNRPRYIVAQKTWEEPKASVDES